MIQQPNQWLSINNRTIQIQLSSQALCLDCSPDGKYVVCGFLDHKTRIYDPKTQQQVGSNLEGHSKEVRSVKYSPNGDFIASGSEDGTIRIWNARTQQQFGSNLENKWSVNSVGYSPDGQYIVSASWQAAKIWSCKTQKQDGDDLIGYTDGVYGIQYCSNGEEIVGGSGGILVFWDSITRQIIRQFIPHQGGGISSFQQSPDDKLIVTCSGDEKTVKLWDAQSCQLIQELHIDGSGYWCEQYPIQVRFSPDSKLVIIGTRMGDLQLWSAINAQQAVVDYIPENEVKGIFSRDGRFIIYVSEKNYMSITPLAMKWKF